jgi:hypothetical protein
MSPEWDAWIGWTETRGGLLFRRINEDWGFSKPDSLDVALQRSSVVVVVIDMGAW